MLCQQTVSTFCCRQPFVIASAASRDMLMLHALKEWWALLPTETA